MVGVEHADLITMWIKMKFPYQWIGTIGEGPVNC